MEGYIKIKFGREESMSNETFSTQKPVSIVPSGYFGDSPDNIVTIENFLTDKELSILYYFAISIKEWDYTETEYNENGTMTYDSEYWKDRVASAETIGKQTSRVVPIMRGIANRAKPIIDNFFNVNAYSTGPCIVKWMPGQYQSPHADKELHEGLDAGKPNSFPHYDIGCIYYLNDDYEGGELYFPNQGIEIKPKPGNLYFFPGDRYYVHGVKEIISGNRYTCPTFWTVASFGEKK